MPETCLLILDLPDKYRRPATYQDTPSAPVLILDEIRDGETNRSLLARIVGRQRFDGVNKKIGSRELFFIFLLFKSSRSHDFAGERITVISEVEASLELLKWRDDCYLRFSGKDEDKPAHRIQKMWREFVRQIEKEKNLKKLFTNAHKSVDGQRLYAIRLLPDEKQIAVTSIPALFRRSTG
jgi:hypothetical protein